MGLLPLLWQFQFSDLSVLSSTLPLCRECKTLPSVGSYLPVPPCSTEHPFSIRVEVNRDAIPGTVLATSSACIPLGKKTRFPVMPIGWALKNPFVVSPVALENLLWVEQVGRRDLLNVLGSSPLESVYSGSVSKRNLAISPNSSQIELV